MPQRVRKVSDSGGPGTSTALCDDLDGEQKKRDKGPSVQGWTRTRLLPSWGSLDAAFSQSPCASSLWKKGVETHPSRSPLPFWYSSAV